MTTTPRAVRPNPRPPAATCGIIRNQPFSPIVKLLVAMQVTRCLEVLWLSLPPNDSELAAQKVCDRRIVIAGRGWACVRALPLLRA